MDLSNFMLTRRPGEAFQIPPGYEHHYTDSKLRILYFTRTDWANQRPGMHGIKYRGYVERGTSAVIRANRLVILDNRKRHKPKEENPGANAQYIRNKQSTWGINPPHPDVTRIQTFFQTELEFWPKNYHRIFFLHLDSIHEPLDKGQKLEDALDNALIQLQAAEVIIDAVLQGSPPENRITPENRDGRLRVDFDDPSYVEADCDLITAYFKQKFGDRINLTVVDDSSGLCDAVHPDYTDGNLVVTFTPSHPLRQILADCSTSDTRGTGRPVIPQGIICPHGELDMPDDPLTTRVQSWLKSYDQGTRMSRYRYKVVGSEPFRDLPEVCLHQRYKNSPPYHPPQSSTIATGSTQTQDRKPPFR
jgi:hypothetical protein